jgi:hypothetical protein
MYIKFWSETLKGRDHSEDVRIDGKIVFKWVLGTLVEMVWTGCIWLRIRPSG